MIRRLLLVCGLLMSLIGPALAVNPNERLADPVLEARARVLSQELRCLECQNQSIDESNAPIAHDLRMLVRDRLTAGDTDPQVIEYLRHRYGEFVMLDPPVERATWLLWYGPPLLLACGACGLAISARRRRATVEPPPLSPAEQARLNAIIGTQRIVP